VDKQILDAYCGSRMFWFDKEHPATVFMDNRMCVTIGQLIIEFVETEKRR